jgi:TRAP-type C4-dicarboxylate transport system permease large subunit
MTGAAQAITHWIASFGLSQLALLLVLLVFYVVLGTFMDAMSMLVLTVPIVIPVVVAAGIDPVWFGIFIVIMCEIALITPPVGMNLFVVQGIRRDRGPYSDVTRGALPYVVLMAGFTVLLMVFPQIVTWLPQTLAAR